MDEGLLIVSSDSEFPVCGDLLLDDDRLLTLVESGKMEPMKKDPSFLKFVPDSLGTEEEAEDSVVNVYHAECLIATAQYEWGNFGPQQCAACGKIFLEEIPRWAFRFQLGGVGLDEAFVADVDPASSAMICHTCFSHFFLGDAAGY